VVNRIVFFGTPEFAVPSLDALIRSRCQVAALVSQPDRPKGRGQQLQPTPTKQLALAHGVPVLQPAKIRDEAFLDEIRRLAPDLGVVVAFGRILPDSLLSIPRFGMINVHGSLLPKYRGAAPVQRAVLAGESETGVTIMRLVQELDAGPMLASKRIPIPYEATSGEVETAVAHAGAVLLLGVIDDISAGRAVETPQNSALATYAPKMTKEEGLIDWAQPARVTYNKVRGLQPWPTAWTHFRGSRCVIRRCGPTGMATALAPGTVARAEGDDLVIACGGGSAMRVYELQPEGKRAMSARDFLAGHRPRVGDRFGV
jgi:methionyl-tRNA formyltransferase